MKKGKYQNIAVSPKPWEEKREVNSINCWRTRREVYSQDFATRSMDTPGKEQSWEKRVGENLRLVD